ncbi:Peroxisomal leader peptide-processing protease [Cyberlindnera fabianii]|uniref:Serine protease n=1 Tax=Cyberlindnera fabianii TaxID=36022 RepID=A0A1V2LFD6_CYBFA|nr:Peroxisomal leader peptide-processing protease [Cyberlindnera fabianii]
MTWRYVPVAIHLEHSSQHALSGVFLLNTSTGQHYVLTVTDLAHPDRYSFKFVSPWCIGPSTITWLPLTLSDSRRLTEGPSGTPRILRDFIEGLQRDGHFKFKPNSSQQLTVLHLRIPETCKTNLAISFTNPDNLLPITFKRASDTPIPSKVALHCCPFSLTSVAIFINHKVYGSAALNLGNAGFLTDVKYLDDVIGGVVFLDSSPSESIGIMCGAVTKMNGDGELSIVASWDAIFSLLNYKDLTFPAQIENVTTSQVLTLDPSRSVVRISVIATDGRFWGSGVCIAPNLIVTNKHVLKSFDSLKDLHIRLPGKPNLSLHLKDVTIHESPMQGFDLCFIRLKNPCIDLQPDESTMLFTKIWKVSDQETKSMIIASAGCWNGSSGGGLFNQNNELVGIMTSNGKLSCGEVMPNFTLAIPINIIEKSRFMLENNLPSVDLKQKVGDLWSLRETHNSVLDSNTPTVHKL